MNNDSKRLLDEVLEETAPADFRTALMAVTLHHVRRRRRLQSVKRGLLILTLLLGMPTAFWWTRTLRPSDPAASLVVRRPSPPSFNLVHSHPLDPTLIVETRSGGINLVSSAPTHIAMIETNPGEHLFRELTDEQLLGLLAGRPAALVRPSPDHAQLLFLNPEDESGFPVQ